MTRRRQTSKVSFAGRGVLATLCLLLLLSGWQYQQDRSVTWHVDLAYGVQDFLAGLGDLWRGLQDEGAATAAQQAPLVIDSRAVAGNADQSAASPDPGPERFELVGRVLEVVDGDTIEIGVQDLEFTIRLFGIDAPERDQQHGTQATSALARRLDRRKVLVTVQDVDNYGRLVGTVFHQGENVNRALVSQGHAWWYRQYARDQRDLELAELRAREAGLGLWSAVDPVAPWDWRRR